MRNWRTYAAICAAIIVAMLLGIMSNPLAPQLTNERSRFFARALAWGDAIDRICDGPSINRLDTFLANARHSLDADDDAYLDELRALSPNADWCGSSQQIEILEVASMAVSDWQAEYRKW